MTNWAIAAPEFLYFSLACLALFGVSWYLLRDSAELFESGMGKAGRLVPDTFLGRLRLFSEVAIFVAAVVGGGLWLCDRTGIKPFGWAADGGMEQAVLIAARGLFCGILVSLAFDTPRYLMFRKYLAEWDEPVRFANWRRYLGASLGAGVGEELVFRFLLFPLLAWLIGLVSYTSDGLPTTFALWSSLIVTSILFAATHVPVVGELGGYTIGNVFRAMLVFVPPGLLLGVVFWRYGVETAIVTHASGLAAGWFYVSALRAVVHPREA